MSELNYEKDTSIDEHSLDVEWLEQPRITMRYTKLEAERRRDYDQAKANLDIVEAELDQDIRNDPEGHGLPKVTEGAIKAAILMTKKYKEAQKELHEAQYELNMAQAAVRSVYAKKDALENLVRLHGQQYFAGPSVPRDIGKEWEQKQKQKQSNKKVKIKRKRTS